MVRLRLLGFTQDLKGLVFGQRKGAKRASFWVPVDDELMDAIAKLERARSERDRKKATPRSTSRRAGSDRATGGHAPAVGRSERTSGMGAREIQQLLRQGRSIKNVADVANASQAWVERLAEPVQEERAGVVRLAQRATMHRPRLGRSGLAVGDAVVRNLEERRATPETIDALDDSWDARTNAAGRWRVSLRFAHRGKRRSADWEFNKTTREITPRNRLASQLGWWEPEPDEVPEPPEPEDDADGDEEPTPKPKRKARTRAASRPKRQPPRRRPAAKRSR